MKLKAHIFIAVLFLELIFICNAQDPHYSQFFMAPSAVNPAITGSSQADWRLLSNYRRQWNNAGTPYNTASLTGEINVFKNITGENSLATSLSIQTDNSLGGAYKSNYASANLAYHMRISKFSKIGAGIISQLVSRTLDISALTFGSQFTSGGFDVSLPSGETALNNMIPFVSLGSGFLYQYERDKLGFNLGVSAYNLNRPRQTFFSDPSEYLPIRYASNFNFQYAPSARILLGFNSIFQIQKRQSYFSFGGSLGLDINWDRNYIMYFGAWYRSNDAITPYWGFQIGNTQLGISYDVTTSKQNFGPSIPRAVEFSLVIRQKSKIPGIIPCPWN
jgi:type IX secretion system PorP/SprF family membrane protein